MQTIHRYVMQGYVVTFLSTLLVLTFVMSIGVLFRVTDLLARGLSWQPIVQMALSGIPSALGFSIPVSVLVTSLLVFGRLSADSEISAMKACGMSMWQIISPCILLSILLSACTLYIHNELAPASHFIQRQMTASAGASAVELIEEGRFVEVATGMRIYVGRRQGNAVQDVRIHDLRDRNMRREIKAESGTISASGTSLVMELVNGRIDPIHEGRVAQFEKMTFSVDNIGKRRAYTKRNQDKTFVELVDALRYAESCFLGLSPEEVRKERTATSVELNKRLVLSFSCFAFAILGIPLGIKTQRKDSSVGVGISIFLVFAFYLFVIVAESLKRHPGLFPDLIVWIPAVVSVVLGTILVKRAT